LSKRNRKKRLNNRKTKKDKRIAITLGDAAGIGPEVIYKSLQDHVPSFPVVIIGSINDYEDKSVRLINRPEETGEKGIYFYHIDQRLIEKDASFEYVKTGINWALVNKVQALVTAPISKEKWLRSGITEKGHTELLVRTANVDQHAMFFWSEHLKVVLFTIHIPLKKIFEYIKKDAIIRFIRFAASELSRLFSREFIFLVSGLNPHSGENGFLGNEEIDVIIPAIEVLRSEISIHGPFPPDIIFLRAKDIKDAVVISWYHDQGLIPFKLLSMHSGVNLTLGLPYIRTSPGHGTAYDIAGKGIANPSSMKEAIRLAEFLISRDKQ
jgi:4-hydroxythreonine-4-phosphate dehydrogenase